jgi:hypothetical protein
MMTAEWSQVLVGVLVFLIGIVATAKVNASKLADVTRRVDKLESTLEHTLDRLNELKTTSLRMSDKVDQLHQALVSVKKKANDDFEA